MCSYEVYSYEKHRDDDDYAEEGIPFPRECIKIAHVQVILQFHIIGEFHRENYESE